MLCVAAVTELFDVTNPKAIALQKRGIGRHARISVAQMPAVLLLKPSSRPGLPLGEPYETVEDFGMNIDLVTGQMPAFQARENFPVGTYKVQPLPTGKQGKRGWLSLVACEAKDAEVTFKRDEAAEKAAAKPVEAPKAPAATPAAPAAPALVKKDDAKK